MGEEIVQSVKKKLSGYREFLKGEGKEWLSDRKERSKRYAEIFSADKLDGLDESVLSGVVKELWANIAWTNKQYVVDRVLQSNDIGELREMFKDLLWGSDSLRHRFDRFFKRVKGLGPAQTTEIMCFARPTEFAIWNERSRRALRVLGLGNEIPVNKYRISGEEYERFVIAAKQIEEVLKAEGVGEDLLDVDLFLYYIQLGAEQDYLRVSEVNDFDHDEVVEKLVELGAGLGFEVESERTVSTGARVDVVWRAKIGNLGVIKYVFEVHKSGSIDSAILNLMKAKKDQSVQKIVIVSNKDGLDKFKKETEDLPEDFRKTISYLTVGDVLEASNLMQKINNILSKLELIKTM